MKTNINNLDKILGEITPGECLSIGARPGVGKTALALQIALNTADNGKKVLFITPEMSGAELMEYRIFRNKFQKDMDELAPFIKENPIENLQDKMESILNNMQIETKINSGKELLDVIKYKISRAPIDLIVIDNVSFIDTPRELSSDKEEILEVTSELRELAKENNTAIIYTNQLLPLDDTTEPQITDLRCAYALSKNVDKIILVWNKENVSPVTILNCKVISLGKTEEISYNKETQTITD